MSALELAGPLRMLCSMPHRLKGRQFNVWVDNSGSVIMYKKGIRKIRRSKSKFGHFKRLNTWC